MKSNSSFPSIQPPFLREALVSLGVTPECLTVQSDEYFDDPLRGFADLDYALRIRGAGDRYWLTFKGPNLDATAKMRKETEVSLADRLAAETMKQIFMDMGFQEIAKVKKTRERMSLNWLGTPITICLDQVEEVGEFVELEIVAADEGEAELAKSHLRSLAEELKLEGGIRTSYLELLLANRSR